MKNPQSGFTLVELLVSIGIFSLITTLAVWNHSQFNGSIMLTNLAYEVALSVRQAQFYGITVKKSSQEKFDAGYGVHFEHNSASYVMFEDRPIQNYTYAANGSESIETFSIRKGNKIGKICVDGSCNVTKVDISFTRPNPDAIINPTGGGGGGGYGGVVEVCVSSPQGTHRKVVVESTGQISVQVDDGTKCD